MVDIININDKPLSLFGISKVIKFSYETSNYNNLGSYWNETSLKPMKGIKNETYRKLKTSFLFLGNDRDEINKNISRFVEECKGAIFKYNKLNFYSELLNNNEPDPINPKISKLELEFNLLDVYENEKSITTTSSTDITINSPKPCYANLELNASTAVISCTININDVEIVVNNIKENETIYIGSGKVVAGGKSKINDVDIWEFPKLKPGVNNISISREDVSLTVKYNERW